jgi:ABC-type multidrug transport system permease subunit
MMRFAWSTALKDWRRHKRDPVGLIMWLGIPLLIGGLMVLVVGGTGGPKPQAHVLVADEDDSFLSGMLVGAMSQNALGGLIRAEEVEQGEGRARMDEGDATALLIIPEGFGAAVLKEEPTTLELITNPSQTILPGIVEEGLSILVDATFYAHRVIGEDLREFAEGPPGGQNVFADSRIAEFSVKINQLVERLGDYLFPPLIQIEAVAEDETDEDEDGVSVALLFLPSILFMALLFMSQGLSIDLWHEREEKTLRRVVVSPQTLLTFLCGKLLSGVGLMFGVCLVALAIGYAYFRLDITTLPLALGWTIVSGAFLTVMMTVLQVHATSQRAGGLLTMAVMFPLMMVGGSFFPFEAMPAGMALVGKLTPNGWALEQLKRILLDEVELEPLVFSFLGLLVVGFLLFMLSARRIKTRFIQS